MDALLELRGLIARHAGEGHQATALPRVSLVSASVISETVWETTQPSLTLVVQGVWRAVVGEREVRCGTAQYLASSIVLPVTSSITEARPERHFLALVLALEPVVIADMLMHYGPQDAHLSADLVVADAPPAMLKAALRLLKLLDSPQQAAMFGSAYECELLWQLLTPDRIHGGTLTPL